MTMHTDRLLIVLSGFGWYIINRYFIYNIIMRHDIFEYHNNFDFWWSFYMAVPFSFLSAILLGFIIWCILWIFKK